MFVLDSAVVKIKIIFRSYMFAKKHFKIFQHTTTVTADYFTMGSFLREGFPAIFLNL